MSVGGTDINKGVGDVSSSLFQVVYYMFGVWEKGMYDMGNT